MAIRFAITQGQPALIALVDARRGLQRPETPLHDGRRVFVQTQVATVMPDGVQRGGKVLPQLQRRVTGSEVAHHRTDALLPQQPGPFGFKVGQSLHLVGCIGDRLVVGLPGVVVFKAGWLQGNL